jgi:hypothetical protein
MPHCCHYRTRLSEAHGKGVQVLEAGVEMVPAPLDRQKKVQSWNCLALQAQKIQKQSIGPELPYPLCRYSLEALKVAGVKVCL